MPALVTTAKLLLTFDVEEFDLPLEYGQAISWEQQLAVGQEGWEWVLRLLEEFNLPATLFVTGAIAQAFPHLLRHSARQHEIGSHNLRHALDCPPEPVLSRQVLLELGAPRVAGYRSPRFAPVANSALKAAGYTYNASLNPVWLPGRYNNRHWPRRPFVQEGLRQFPLSATPGVRWPLFWLTFKNLPWPVFAGLAALNLRSDGYLHLLFHPWEFCAVGWWKLPRLVVGCQGEALRGKLRNFLLWVLKRTQPQTLEAYLAEHFAEQGQSQHF